MAEDGKIVYKVVIDSTGAVTAAEEAGRRAGKSLESGSAPHTSKFQEMMIGAARRIGEAFVDMTARAVKGVEQIAQAGIEFNAKMETYQTAFTTLLGTEEEAARVMEQIRKDAAATPFDVDSLTQANQLLIASGVAAGDARNDVLNLANAISATGGGSAELARMATNMQQIKNVGKATAMDIRQFAMAGINIYQLLADSTGKTVEEVSELDVTYDMLSAALARASEEGGRYAGAMEKQSQTFTGRISTLKDNALLLAGELTSGLFEQLSGEALPKVIEWVDTLLQAAQTGGISGAIDAAKTILSNLVSSFLEELPQMAETGVSLLTNLLTGLAGSGAVSKVFAAMLTILRAILNAIVDHLPEILAAGVTIIMQLLQGIWQTTGTLLAYIWELIVRLFNAFLHADWGSIGRNIVNGIKAGISGLWGSLIEEVKQAVSNLWQSAKNALGIASPSKKFKYIGEMSVKGTEAGFEEGEDELTRTVRTIYSNVAEDATDSIVSFPSMFSSPDYSGLDSIERNVSFNLAATGTTGETVITVPLFINDREFARATAWDMGEQLAWREV